MKAGFLLIILLFISGLFNTTRATNSSYFKISFFEDKTDSMKIGSIKDIISNNKNYFLPADSLKGPFKPTSTYWLYLEPTSDVCDNGYVLSFHIWVSHIEVYPFPYTSVSGYGGRMVPGRSKALPGNNVYLNTGSLKYLIKVKNRAYSVASAKNFEIIPIQNFLKKKEKDDLAHGLMLGFFGLMLIYNLIFFLLDKKKLHLYYVLYILLNSLFLFFTFNCSEIYLFPNNYIINHVLLTFQLFGTFFYTLFVRTALLEHCSNYTPFIDKNILMRTAYVMLGVNFIIGTTAFFRIDIYLVAQGLSNFVNSILAIGLLIYCYKHSDTFMRIIFAGSMVMISFGYINIIVLWFFIGSFSMFYETGLIIELLLFTYALNKQHFEEKYRAELKKRQLTEEIEGKNRALVFQSIQISAKEEAIASINEKLKELGLLEKSEHNMFKEVSLQSNLNKNLWKEFEIHFNDTHPDFYRLLMKKYNTLTQNEVRLCAFLKLNLNTKEISIITQKSPRSIEVMRSRIRQKMNLQRDDNLSLILSQITKKEDEKV